MLCCGVQLVAQEISIQPYLQDASPTSISILWETTSAEESVVEWGATDALGNTTLGIAYPSNGEARIHEVEIQGLQRFTKYFYRVNKSSRGKSPLMISLHLVTSANQICVARIWATRFAAVKIA